MNENSNVSLGTSDTPSASNGTGSEDAKGPSQVPTLRYNDIQSLTEMYRILNNVIIGKFGEIQKAQLRPLYNVLDSLYREIMHNDKRLSDFAQRYIDNTKALKGGKTPK